MAKAFYDFLETETRHLSQAGLLRAEQRMSSPQGPTVAFGKRELLNLVSADYLGLSSHPEVKEAARRAIDAYGVGVAAQRMATGTLDLHARLEAQVAHWLGVEDAVVFPSGYHANTGLFESLVGDRDFIVCDEQIHPSLADGVRLSRAHAYSFRNGDMEHLEDRLKRSRSARFRFIVTDGVFPLDGSVAKLKQIHELAERYGALVAVDDGQGLGALGPTGRGAYEAFQMTERIDVLTGTFGNALGGGAGGFVAGRKHITTWLRQKSRPYLVSTALAPSAAAAAHKAIELVKDGFELREKLQGNVHAFRRALSAAGLKTLPSEHPAVAVLIGDAVQAQRMTDLLHRQGIFVMGFCHPVVPEGAARIRAQVTAAHSQKALEGAAAAIAKAAEASR